MVETHWIGMLAWPLAWALTSSGPLQDAESRPAALETVRASVVLTAGPGDVWAALTTKEGIEGWLAPHAELDLKLGGLLRTQMDPALTLESPGTRAQRVVCYEPWRLLSLAFEAMETDPARVKRMAGGVTNILIEAQGKGSTKVTFAWAGPLTAAERADFAPAQTMILKSKAESLAKAFEGKAAAETAASRPGRQLTQVFTFKAPVARVWSAFTKKDEVEAWMTPLAEIDLRAGGAFRTHYDKKAKIGDPGTAVQRILTVEPERILAFQSIAPENAPPFVRVACQAWSILYFEPAEGGATRITLTGVNYGEGPEWDQAFKFFETGNRYTMQQLERYLSPPK
jgi:uncharacterized protein YndB with AHSA1/START domain